MFLKAFFFVFIFAHQANSHGLLLEPPNRSTLWRFKDSDPAIMPYKDIVEANYNDNELFCGGAQYQANLGGLCGLCGDPYDNIRENEAGGKYGKGIIVRKYPQGSLMPATVRLTAHHLGFFEFRLCEWNNQTIPGTHECLNKNILKTENGNTQYFPDSSGGTPWEYEIKLQLPAEVICSQCILQWRYHAGNTWNCDENGNCCTGCGPQEEFYGCADIAIGDVPILPPPNWNESSPVSTTTATDPITNAPPTTTTTITTTTPVTSETNVPPSGTSCEGKPPGIKYPETCTTFYECGPNEQGPFKYACPPGTVYDEERNLCDHSVNVPPPCGTKV